MKNTSLRSWNERAARINIENCEYVHDASGSIIGGKAPNAKKLREFYKKRDKALALRTRGKKKQHKKR